MPVVDFFSRPGGVAVLAGAYLPPVSLLVENWAGGGAGRGGSGFLERNSVLTQASVQLESGRQWLHTLEDMAFLYVFGERVGEMTLSGVAMPRACGGGERRELDAHGLYDVMAYHDVNRLTRRAEPLNVVIGFRAFECLLRGVGFQAADPDSGLAQFTLRLDVIPPATFGSPDADAAALLAR